MMPISIILAQTFWLAPESVIDSTRMQAGQAPAGKAADGMMSQSWTGAFSYRSGSTLDRTLTRAAEPAGGVAGHGVALHAGPAHVNTLIDLLGVVARVMLGDAGALFGSVINLLRTGRETSSEDHQAKQTSQWHVARSRLGAPEPVARAKPPTSQHLDGTNSFGKIVFKLRARDRRPNVIRGLDKPTIVNGP
jgi:hypothetical protein